MRHLRGLDHARPRTPADEGQVSVLVVLAVGLFLLLFVGFGVDMTNLFFHRQTAQNAADAACVAAGTDMYVNQINGGSAAGGGFKAGTTFDCSGNSAYAPCQYAALNGYSSPSATPLPANTETNGVHVSFPASVPGVVPADSTITGPYPFVEVDVYDEVKVYFASLLSGTPTQTVHALAKCGLLTAQAPVPIIVLDPICTHAFEIQDTSATLQIIGGPSKSVQVNSNNSTCAAATSQGGCSAGGTVDLQYGGTNFTGSDFGVYGAPTAAPSGFKPGTTGAWLHGTPIGDPWANLIAPAVPSTVNPPTKLVGVPPYSTSPGHIQYEDGCPDLTNGCTEYSPGLYTNPIVVIGYTAIFDPGIYYVTGSQSSGGYCGTVGFGCITKPTGQCRAGFIVDSNGVVRPADPTEAAGDGSYGTLFYFSTAGGGNYESAFFGANAGKAGNRTIDNFPLYIGKDPHYPGLGMNCPNASAPQNPGGGAPPLPAGGFAGDIIVGPCTGPGGVIPSLRYNYSVQGKDAVNTTQVVNYHGMLMWDDRANNDIQGQPTLSGGGGLLIAGNLYFHNCPEAPGLCASPPTDYNAFFSLGGNTGSSTYIFGNITTDELVQTGGGTITMELNPNLVVNILKVALLQ